MIGFSFVGSRRGFYLAVVLACLAVSTIPVSAQRNGFDHSRLNRLLERAVIDGRVAYHVFRDQPVFDSYLTSLASARPSLLGTNDRLAFWINAYNALTIRNVNNHPGIERPTDIAGFFDKRSFKVAGEMLTLDDIQNRIIRRQFNEPLIHFGLVCAAVNCPPLLPRAYSGKTVRADLAANARAYLASDFNRFDARSGLLSLSKIFEWYAKDFGGEAGIKRFVRKYGTPAMTSGVKASTRVVFLEYDWTLNRK